MTTKIMLDLSPAGIKDRAKRFNFEPLQLRTPLTRYAISDLDYGLDNGCFSGNLHPSWKRLLAEAKLQQPLWATSPDVVGSARRTLELWDIFSKTMAGLPRALVLQDGIGAFNIPWNEVACVFVGGSDEFKLSDEAFACAKTAKILGLYVHVGRVNTFDRSEAWKGLADSFDGSGMSKYDRMLKDVLCSIRGEQRQSSLSLDGTIGRCLR